MRLATGLVLCLAAATAAAQSPLLSVDLADANPARVDVLGLADVDGDGWAELAIRTGADVRVVSGQTGAVLHTTSMSSGSGFGRMGDVDGDGIGEIVVTAGDVLVLSGASGAELLRVSGGTFYSTFGAAASGAGDVDGDGTPDLLVGDPSYPDGLYAPNGQVTVFSGADGSVLPGAFGGAYENQGSHVSALDDVDGDGLADWLTASSFATYAISGADGSAIWVQPTSAQQIRSCDDQDGDGLRDFLLSLAGTIELRAGTTGTVLASFTASAPDEPLGIAAALVDDLTGDGIADLAVEGLGREARGRARGAWLIDGASGARLFALHRTAYLGQDYGRTLAALDLDGDGALDLAVGGRGDVGGDGTDGPAAVDVHDLFQDCDGNGVRDHVDVAAGALADADANTIPDRCDPLPVAGGGYCSASVIAGCAPAVLRGFGKPSASAPWGFVLVADDLCTAPNGTLHGVFFYGTAPAAIPFSSGVLCVAPPLSRTTEQAFFAEKTLHVDFGAYQATLAANPLGAGTTGFAQLWYETGSASPDPALTSAVSFTILP